MPTPPEAITGTLTASLTEDRARVECSISIGKNNAPANKAAFQALQNQGVVVVLGDMVLDNSAFELPPRDPVAFDGEALRPYNASPDALLVNFKSVVLKFSPDSDAGVARVFHPGATREEMLEALRQASAVVSPGPGPDAR